MFTAPLRYINGDELSAIIKSDKVPNKDYIVIDVRDDDWVGGNIKNSVNLPSDRFLEKVSDLVAETRNIPTVVFHCALSQARGPKAARVSLLFKDANGEVAFSLQIYAEARHRLQKEGKDVPNEVLVLRGGFTEFQAKFKNDPELVENWDKTIWNSPYH